MNLFLTGPRQVGKSTALRRALAMSGARAAGLMTRFGAPGADGSRPLYLLPFSTAEAWEPPRSAPVCALLGGGRRAFPQVFDTAGTALLRAAASAQVLVLDELGFLEAEAGAFHAAVLELLAGDRPVIGVVREGLGCWADAPFGELLPVTAENRDGVPRELCRWLARYGGGREAQDEREA